jgi:beta-glucosidase
LNRKIIVILTGGGGIETESWLPAVPAFIHCFYLGETIGQAVGEAIFGRINPSGKLPITMERSLDDIPAMRGYPPDYERVSLRRVFVGQGNPRVRKTWPLQYPEGLMVGYRHFVTAGTRPLFPFGFGLSYTSFVLEDIALSARSLAAPAGQRISASAGGLPAGGAGTSPAATPPASLTVSVTVRNTGSMAGAETVQLYIREEKPALPRPERELRGFEKVFLKPGENRRIALSITVEDLSFYDTAAGCWRAEPGRYTALIGTSCLDIAAELEFTLEKGSA